MLWPRLLWTHARRFCDKLGRPVEQTDYEKRGVMATISETAHDRYWANKAANKSADFMGVTSNLFKALRKVVSWTDPQSEERRSECLSYEAFDFSRHLMNVVVYTKG